MLKSNSTLRNPAAKLAWAAPLIALCLLATARTTKAAVNLFNLATGLDAANNLITVGGQADAHWTIDLAAGGAGPAQAVTPSSADWGSSTQTPWPANGPNSDWIARNANSSNNGFAPYSFYRSFDLTGYNLSTISISGAWTMDDSASLYLNGHLLDSGQNTWYPSESLVAFSVAQGSSFFNQGVNQLTITLTYADLVDEGARLEGFVSAVPEPSSFALLGLGCAALVSRLRKRRI
jgi:hypothetical protein